MTIQDQQVDLRSSAYIEKEDHLQRTFKDMTDYNSKLNLTPEMPVMIHRNAHHKQYASVASMPLNRLDESAMRNQ